MGLLKKLSEQHIAFIEYLLQTNGNQYESAVRAGYAQPSARQKGSELCADPLIKAEYNRRRADIIQAAAVTSERVIAEIANLAFANIDDVLSWQGGRLVDNPNYLTPDEHKDRDVERQTQEALGHTLEPIDPKINTTSRQIWQREQITLTDSKTLTRQTKGAVSEVSLTPGKFGDKLSIKMHSKLDALGKLVNILGINQPKQINLNTTVESTTFGIKRRAPVETPAAGHVSGADTTPT